MGRVLQLPAYRRLFVAYALNQLALSIASLALSVLVYRRTGSALGAAGFFISALFVPALISPALVARIDRLAARTVLPVLFGLEAIAFLGLAALASSFSLGPLLVLVLLDGVLAVTARALVRAATVAVTVPAGLLREGNALLNAAFSVCGMAGPALGGVIAAQGGTVAALLVDSGLLIVVALTLVRAPGLPGAVSERVTSAGRLRAALSHAVRRPAVRALLGLQTLGLLFFTISIPVEVVFALHVLHTTQAGYGALLSSWGLGTVAGSTIYAHWRGLPARVLIALGAGSLGAGFVVMAAAPSLAVAMIGGALAGCGNGIEAVAARTALQEHVEEEWMGMMMSLNESMFQAVPGIGIVLGGGLAALAGPRVALAVAGAGAFVVSAIAWVLLSPAGALRPSPAEPAPPTAPIPPSAAEPAPSTPPIPPSAAEPAPPTAPIPPSPTLTR